MEQFDVEDSREHHPRDKATSIMAGSLHVRNRDDELIARLKRRAVRHGRSAEAEHREIL